MPVGRWDWVLLAGIAGSVSQLHELIFPLESAGFSRYIPLIAMLETRDQVKICEASSGLCSELAHGLFQNIGQNKFYGQTQSHWVGKYSLLFEWGNLQNHMAKSVI